MKEMTPEKEKLALLPCVCPFCKRKPSFGLTKKTGCQMHGDPIQHVTLGCKNPYCPAKPCVIGGDIYRNGEGQFFKETERKVREETIIEWNSCERSSDLTDQRIAALEEKLAMAEKVLRIVRAIANGDKAEIISQGYDFKSPVKLSDWCMAHIDKALSAISAKDGAK